MWDDVKRISNASILKERNVIKMFSIKAGDLPNVRNFIFITRPKIMQ